MKKLGVIAIVAVGLIAILQATMYAGFAFSAIFYGGVTEEPRLLGVAAAILPVIGAFAVGALLISYRKRLADRWFEEGEVSTSVDAASLLRLAIVGMGLWMIASSLPPLLGSVIYGVGFDAGPEPGVGAVVGALARVLPQLLEIVVGALLIARSAQLSGRLWQGRPVISKSPPQALPVCPCCGEPYEPSDYRDAENAKCSRCKEPLPPARA